MTLTNDLNNVINSINTYGTNLNSSIGSGGDTTIIGGKKNLLDNPDFSLWQRGISSTKSSPEMSYRDADRWCSSIDSGGTVTVSRQSFATGQTDIPGNPKYFFRLNVSASDTTHCWMGQQLSGGIRKIAGLQCTLSFWAKASPSGLKIASYFSQDFGTGGTPSASVAREIETFSLTTDWVRYTTTFTPDSLVGKTFGTNEDDRCWIDLSVSSNGSCPCGDGGLGVQSGIFDIYGMQLVFGDTEVDFEQPDHNDELTKCQAYYCKSYNENQFAGTVNTRDGAFHEMATSTTQWAYCPFKTKMIKSPTVKFYGTYTGTEGKVTQSNGVEYDGFITGLGQNSFTIQHPSIAGLGYSAHYTADAEL